ncbi:MAG: large conductance mechanosensitive channel protein MscL [Bdellovibrionota bacterium]
MLNEFKLFISKGNVLDLSVGIIIGAAFGKIVSSLVGDILMPILGLFAGKVNFSGLFVALDFASYETIEAAKKAGAPLLMYGNFLQSILDFIIIGFAIFLVVKAANKAQRPATVSPTTKECIQCLSIIPLKAKKCAHCTSELV